MLSGKDFGSHHKRPVPALEMTGCWWRNLLTTQDTLRFRCKLAVLFVNVIALPLKPASSVNEMLLPTAKMNNTNSNFLMILMLRLAELTFISDESRHGLILVIV